MTDENVTQPANEPVENEQGAKACLVTLKCPHCGKTHSVSIFGKVEDIHITIVPVAEIIKTNEEENG